MPLAGQADVRGGVGLLVGKNLQRLLIPERLRQAHWVGYRKAMELGSTKHSGKPMLTKSLHQSGSTVYVEMSFSVITDLEHGTIGSVAIAREAGQTQAPK